MNRRPRSRIVTALLALASMLFMQLAVAAYACPSLKTAHPAVTDDAAMPSHLGMAGCHGMDKMQPNLCHAHDQAGTQSLDKPELPMVQPFIAGALTIVFREIDPAAISGVKRIKPFLFARTTAPPLAIQHCCFRI